MFRVAVFLPIAFQVLTTVFALYDGYKVYDVYCKTFIDKEVLTNLSKLSDDYDFIHLTRTFQDPDRVVVPPDLQHDFEMVLDSSLISYNVFNEDVSKTKVSFFTQSFSVSFNSFKYHSYSDMLGYLDYLSRSYPDLVSVKEFGQTFLDRPMKAIYISNDKSKVKTKNVALVDAGIHAREIAAPATALFIINQLVENYSSNKDLVDAFDWVIVPSMNPDGYEFVRSGYILWRRTMTSYFPCAGADPNRNFDFHWSKNGSSPIPCTQNYQGPKPFSEKETRALRDLMFSVADRAKLYLTIHSYGRYLLTPWGHTSDYSDNYEDVLSVAMAGRNAMYEVSGSNYTVGSSTNVLYAASGSSEDYAHGVVGIPIALTMELPAGGTIGFNPPERSVQSIVSESFLGISAMAKRVHEIYPNE
ncbi:hypothetical protein ACFFRR_002368 [Megaselia abdita]